MTIRIDEPPDAAADDDVAGRLLACHARIRRFCATACRLAAAEDPPPAEVVEAAAGVRRYFAEALPLHAEDEDESIAPRLRGRDATVDAALAAMTAEHAAHRPLLERLIELTGDLTARPDRLPALRDALAATADALRAALEAHLRAEEATVLPALARLLPPRERRAIVAEMAARRA
ncbi:MAG: hemerythrin domain-containing protein [Myxococcales bacterium]|nr:hemerythrin domain-containing protein [Myxococcales bacterium]